MPTKANKDVAKNKTSTTTRGHDEQGRRTSTTITESAATDNSTYKQTANKTRAKYPGRPRTNTPPIPTRNGRLKSRTGNALLATAWLAGMIFIGWQEVNQNGGMPAPKKFVGWTVIIGILSLLSPLISPEIASVMAVGFLIGLFVQRQPSSSTDPALANLPKGSVKNKDGSIQLPNGNFIDPQGKTHIGGKTGPAFPSVPPGLS